MLIVIKSISTSKTWNLQWQITAYYSFHSVNITPLKNYQKVCFFLWRSVNGWYDQVVWIFVYDFHWKIFNFLYCCLSMVQGILWSIFYGEIQWVVHKHTQITAYTILIFNIPDVVYWLVMWNMEKADAAAAFITANLCYA